MEQYIDLNNSIYSTVDPRHSEIALEKKKIETPKFFKKNE